jgi:hypothetical protein
MFYVIIIIIKNLSEIYFNYVNFLNFRKYKPDAFGVHTCARFLCTYISARIIKLFIFYIEILSA